MAMYEICVKFVFRFCMFYNMNFGFAKLKSWRIKIIENWKYKKPIRMILHTKNQLSDYILIWQMLWSFKLSNYQYSNLQIVESVSMEIKVY